MEDKLPVYIAVVNLDNDDTGMQLVSFVSEPAIEENFLSFNDQKEMVKLAVENDEKHMCYGPIMLANKKIYRRTEQGFEYYIVFTPENIEHMLQKFMAHNNGNNVDEDHSFKLIDGVTLCQVFIKDTDKGINPTDFPEAEDGSLFGIYHVDNDELWEDIKNGEVKGYSLAGTFDLEKAEAEQFSKQNNNTINNTQKMSKLNKIKEMLKTMLEVFGDIATDKGTLIYDGDEEIKVGDAVKLLDGENNEVDAEDGEYITEDKRKIVVAEGKVESIEDIEEEEPATEDAPADEPVEESASKQKFNAVKLAFELTYEEKYNKIYEAIKTLGLEYFYIVQAADDFAVVASYEEDTEKLYKFDLTWNEDEVTASNQTEVKVEYVPVAGEPEPEPEETPTEEENLQSQEEEKPAESASLSAQEMFAALENEPAKPTKMSKKMEAMQKRGYAFHN